MSGAAETWTLTKPAVASRGGVVASAHALASEAGAGVLADGGNAVDAAVTAGLVLGAVEPWMSGLGGGGYMLVRRAAEQRTWCVDFGMRAPAALDVADYPLAEGRDHDLFGWPAVVQDRNVLGPLSLAVPGLVAGHALALERFGSLDFADALAPAIEHARQGLAADWYATLRIAAAAPDLARFAESARIYLPGGFPPAGAWSGPAPRLALGRLCATLERLRDAGPEDFYRGEVGAALAADAHALGGRLRRDDLAGYRATVHEAGRVRYRDATVHYAPGLTAGPSLHRALDLLGERLAPAPGARPDAGAYRSFAGALARCYAERLETMGDVDDARAPGCTTHLGVVDAAGNVVALTQTLLSVFGSRVVLPGSGVLMNNGVMWFDPRPGRPNSMAPGKRPLSNMCPAIVERADGLHAALGASGGRRILPAVLQLASFLIDYRMSLEEAMHQPRIDASGTAPVSVDRALGAETVAAIAAELPAVAASSGVYPSLYACPNVVARDGDGVGIGAAHVASPWAQACGARAGR